MAQHPELADLAFVLGEWTGHGRGRYPTVESFEYRETVTFSAPPGKPFIAYQQKTWRSGDHPESGTPLHTESGYLRPAGSGRVEMVLAQPTGLVEVLHGTVESGSIALRSTSVERTSTAKEVSTVERNLTVDGDMLRYELLMGAVGQPHQLHLEASLDRQA
jgi:hypothetical protein